MSWRIANINKDIKNDSEFQMALNGMKLKGPSSSKMGDEKLTDDQKTAMDIALKRAKERKAMEFKAKVK